jgi:hypothetical protein
LAKATVGKEQPLSYVWSLFRRQQQNYYYIFLIASGEAMIPSVIIACTQ